MIKKFYKLSKEKLFPVCRSLTGDGNRQTLNLIKKQFPKLKIISFNSGSNVFDWKIPSEWKVKKAYVQDKYGKNIIDFKNNNLHLVGYSIPFKKTINKKKLLQRLHSLPSQKKAIPYITSYYKKYWGFCINHIQKINIEKRYKTNDKFKINIDTNFNRNGKLLIGELIIPGKSKQEILLSTYMCHPSMANDNLSGIIVMCGLIDYFKKFKHLNKTLRFVFLPETIGSIAYINKNLQKLKKNVVGGYNLTCIGDEKKHSYMLSKFKNTPADISLLEAYKKLKIKAKKFPFTERGSDERQYNSPGVNIPMASIFRSKYGTFPEYHTSLDNFNFVTFKGVNGGFMVVKNALINLLNKIIPKNKFLCEPQLSKRGLYSTLSIKRVKDKGRKLTDFLQYADGRSDLNSISKSAKLKKKEAKNLFRILKKHNLVEG